jgi:rRNA-processing protein FCF1
LDTNALFLPVRSGFPLEAEVDRWFPGACVLVTDAAFRELDQLVDRGTPKAAAARAFADRFERTAARNDADDAVLEVAVREDAIVVTADRELQGRLRRRGISVLSPRDRHRLELRPGLAAPTNRRGRSSRAAMVKKRSRLRAGEDRAVSHDARR